MTASTPLDLDSGPHYWSENISTTIIQYSGYRTVGGWKAPHSYNDKPARIEETFSNKSRYECWYKHGLRHRLTGPAGIFYRNGKVERLEYCLNDRTVSKEEFEKHYLITFLEEYDGD